MRPALFALTLGLALTQPGSVAAAVPLVEPTDCSIQNLSPSLPVGAEARYVVQLFGGNGSYSVSFAYGDGVVASLT